MANQEYILVTGGSGFIGSNFIRYILKKYPNYHVINLDKLTYAANQDNLKGIRSMKNYSFVKGDICDKERVKGVFAWPITKVVNFAAETHVDRSISDGTPFIKTNVEGTFNLLEVAKERGVQVFLQISTDEVYGSLGKSGFFTETSPLQPNNPYAASKAAAEMLCRAYFRTFFMPIKIVRPSNNFGPRQHVEKLIPKVISNAIQGKPIPLYGLGLNVREWLYVEDHCMAIDLVLHKGKEGEVYNIGGGAERSNKEVIKEILDIMGVKENLVYQAKDRLGHDFRYSLDSSKIKRELGWIPKTSFRDALESTIKWYLERE